MAFGMDRLDHGVRRRGKEAVDLMRARNRFRFRPAVALELGPDAGEADQRPILIESQTRRRPFSWSPGLAQARIPQSC